jgi:hypothetical protein
LSFSGLPFCDPSAGAGVLSEEEEEDSEEEEEEEEEDSAADSRWRLRVP